MERRLAAVMSVDVVGYSRLMEADEAGTLARISEIRRDLIDPLVRDHSGRIIKLMGDGALLEFASVVQAVEFAVAMQVRMAALNRDAASGTRIDYRVGVNLGDIIHEDGDIFGDGVNVAARLESMAEPGGICISGAAYDQVKSKLDCGFDFLGEKQVKNIQEPVRVYKVSPEAGNALKGAAAGGAAAVRRKRASIALRRFQIHSADEDLGDLADALLEDLEIAFAKLRTLEVQASALANAESAAATDYLLQGSVRPRGGKLRINVQVIHRQTGVNVWAERYECSREEFESGPDALIERLVATAQTQILLHDGSSEKYFNDERERVDHLASKAWSLLYRLTPEALDQAQALCEAALSLEPRAARAHQVLAAVLHHHYYMGFTDQPDEVLRLGLDHINRAADINDLDEYTHWMRGNIFIDLRATKKALEAFDRSREINPAFSLAVASAGTACAWAGRSGEAIRFSEQALAANPSDPSNFFRFNTIAVAHFTAGDFEQALDYAERTIGRKKKFLAPHLIRVASSAHLGAADLPAKVAELLEEFPAAATDYAALTPFTRKEDVASLHAGMERALKVAAKGG